METFSFDWEEETSGFRFRMTFGTGATSTLAGGWVRSTPGVDEWNRVLQETNSLTGIERMEQIEILLGMEDK